MWSKEDDIILSATTYYIENVKNKTALLLNSKDNNVYPPKFQLAEGDSISKSCGEIFLTINHFLVFHCTTCDNQFGTLFSFLQHISLKHLCLRREKDNGKDVAKSKDNVAQSLMQSEKIYDSSANDLNREDGISTESINEITEKDLLHSFKVAKTKKKQKLNSIEIQVLKGPKDNESHADSKEFLYKRTPEKKKTSRQKAKKEKPLKLDKISENGSIEIKENYSDGIKRQLDEMSNSSVEDLELSQNLKKTCIVYKCDKCDKIFYRKQTFRAHSSYHSLKRGHECTICDKTFTLKSNLAKHLFRHTNVKNFNCDQCDKNFFSNTELSIHKRVHTGERPYVCFKCGSAFKTTSTHSLHMKRHNNVRSKKCEICEKSFFNAYSLKNHMMGHTNDRPFVCTSCGVSFSRKVTLTQHIKLHVNAKEYVCKLCNKAFNQRPALLSHMNHNHKSLVS